MSRRKVLIRPGDMLTLSTTSAKNGYVGYVVDDVTCRLAIRLAHSTSGHFERAYDVIDKRHYGDVDVFNMFVLDIYKPYDSSWYWEYEVLTVGVRGWVHGRSVLPYLVGVNTCKNGKSVL